MSPCQPGLTPLFIDNNMQNIICNSGGARHFDIYEIFDKIPLQQTIWGTVHIERSSLNKLEPFFWQIRKDQHLDHLWRRYIQAHWTTAKVQTSQFKRRGLKIGRNLTKMTLKLQNIEHQISLYFLYYLVWARLAIPWYKHAITTG